MAKSLLQSEKECYITGSCSNLHKHHIFGGPNRKNSEKYGLWVYLRADWHNMSDYAVHFDKQLDLELKQTAQKVFEEEQGHDKFMAIFHRNYL